MDDVVKMNTSDFRKENSANKTKNNETSEQENDSKPCYEEEHRYVQRPCGMTLLYILIFSTNYSQRDRLQGYCFSLALLVFNFAEHVCVTNAVSKPVPIMGFV